MGQDFSIGQMKGRMDYNPLRNYFFPVEYYENLAGVILPFTKEKKVFFNPRIKDNQHASEVFHNKGYRIERIVAGMNSSDLPWIIAGDEENIRLRLAHEDII